VIASAHIHNDSTPSRPVVLLALLSLLPLACHRNRPRPVSAEEAVLARQTQGLEALIRAAEKGPLIPFEQILVIVDQALVQDLLSAATPYERTIADKYRLRVESAGVMFEDDFALVRLQGRAAMAGHAFREDASAEVSVYGGLDIVELDPVSGILRGRVKIMAVEARRAAVLGVAAPVERLIEDLGREKLEAFGALVSNLEIPVRLDRRVELPAVGPVGGVRIGSISIPMHVSLTDVKAYGGKLFITVAAGVEQQ
jgi:hypothetical protein